MPIETIISKVNKKQFQNLDYDKSFYHSKEWRKLRKYKVTKNPICEVEGCHNATHTVDHIIPIKKGGKPLAWDNLQSLCKRHNFSKTAKQQHIKYE